jgi:hypothetical protein
MSASVRLKRSRFRVESAGALALAFVLETPPARAEQYSAAAAPDEEPIGALGFGSGIVELAHVDAGLFVTPWLSVDGRLWSILILSGAEASVTGRADLGSTTKGLLQVGIGAGAIPDFGFIAERESGWDSAYYLRAGLGVALEGDLEHRFVVGPALWQSGRLDSKLMIGSFDVVPSATYTLLWTF